MYAPGTQEFDLFPRQAGTACMKPSLSQLPNSSCYGMDWPCKRRANQLRVSWHWVCHCWPTASGGINVSKPASKSPPPACQRGLPDDQNPICACFDKHPPVRSSTAHPLCRDLTIGPVPYHPSRARASVGASVGGLAGQQEDSSDSQPQQKAPLLPSFNPIDHPRGIPAGTLEQRLSARIPTEPDWNRRPVQWKTSNLDIEAALLTGTLVQRKVDAAHSPLLGHLVVMRFRLLVTGHHGLRCPLLGSIGLEIGHRCGRDGSLTTKSPREVSEEDKRGEGSYCEKARAYGPQSSDRLPGRAHTRFDV
ncbi:uncharacterized protein BO88DRAFT_428082 [Aspergillus vadensis CBS 113365]|uniref:Uncharacterized protein n=1 Tax=Aspergillus vadensis (strain CBS 113365 / IMI 142717 / IBT 24658) TaxID=1448311 RepID=A0A319B0J1_ASPVC|nr:hypothetical protein BO88DRAFT_428082 [Aspergillus vadensis CBS 113365]PYH66146.1 hypothetical protein BO88DRAFT_428082 [Aspergillus vadensis CBS 113365]